MAVAARGGGFGPGSWTPRSPLYMLLGTPIFIFFISDIKSHCDLTAPKRKSIVVTLQRIIGIPVSEINNHLRCNQTPGTVDPA